MKVYHAKHGSRSQRSPKARNSSAVVHMRHSRVVRMGGWQGFFFIFYRRGKKLKIQRRLRRAFFPFLVLRVFLLIFRDGGIFLRGEKSCNIIWGGIFPPLGGKKKPWCELHSVDIASSFCICFQLLYPYTYARCCFGQSAEHHRVL